MGFRSPHTIQQSNALLDPSQLQQSTSSILHPTQYFAIQNRGFSKMAAERGGVLKRPQQRLGVAIFDSLLREY